MTTAAAVSTPGAAKHPALGSHARRIRRCLWRYRDKSPIYAFRESLKAGGDVHPEATVFGVVSLIFWAITETRAHCPSASSERAPAPAQRSASVVHGRSAAVGVALPDLAAMLGRHGVGQARNRNSVAP